MKLKSFLRGLSLRHRTEFINLLSALAAMDLVHKQMVENLYAESTLSKKDWDEFSNAIMKNRTNPRTAALEIQKFCRNGRSLRGKVIAVDSNTVFGRVKPFEDFCRFLRKVYSYQDIEEARSALVAKIGKPPTLRPSTWNEIRLAEYPMWATFKPSSVHPFGYSLPSAHHLMCSLGLDPPPGPLLIFEYRLPVDALPKIPTFCDAYAMRDWPPRFRRVLDSDSCGMTVPTPPCRSKHGRPEAIHAVIKAKHLVAPLELAS